MRAEEDDQKKEPDVYLTNTSRHLLVAVPVVVVCLVLAAWVYRSGASQLRMRTKASPPMSMDLGAAATFLRKRDGFSDAFKELRGMNMRQLLSGLKGLESTQTRKVVRPRLSTRDR